MVRLAPSILAADFSRLGEQVRETERGGADRIHVDVMDGHFVPNLSMGPVVVKSLRPVTKLPLEVHLMVEDPRHFIPAFFKSGADSVIFHLEVMPRPKEYLEELREQGHKVGLAINPNMPVDALEPFLVHIDLALCMTVFPGFGGQAFLPESPERIRQLRTLIDRYNPDCELEVDGGIDLHTALAAVDAGANVLVAGTSVFRHPDGPAAALRAFRELFSR
ncbi:MAG: ribulose-phosphate 3-epimerase, partial [Gemmataceae bacterium]|nr:ribulose-phosphate 3-epimerase [Gemmataceae bacterium]